MPQSSAKPFSGIFISYRRDDSSGHAGRLFDKLVDRFGKDRIFMDIDTIEPGEDFVKVIEEAVASCEVLIAVIGRSWLSSAGRNTGRFENPNDFVRLEITTALSRDIRVIPVLVQRASMPKPQDLPADLATLTRRNAIELSDLRWQSDVEQLIDVLERNHVKREEAVRLAEAARQAEVERQRKSAEEKRGIEEQEQLRLAEEKAKQRAASERRREEEEKERREAEQRARHDAQEASKRRAEEERVQAEIETRRLAEKETERRRIEADQQAERRRLDEEKQERDQPALIPGAEEAQRQRAKSLQAGREEKHSKSEFTPIIKTPVADQPEKFFHSNALAQAATALPVREDARRTTMLIIGACAAVVISACVAALIIVGLIWMRQTAQDEHQSENLTTTPENTEQTEQTTAPLTTEVPQPPPGMVYVPGGELAMGRNGNDPLETPQHKVSVEPFFIDIYEVTCEEYKKFLDANPDHAAPPDWANRNYPDGYARKPVTGVDWDDAVTYSAWCGKRLPREEEWEFAARGTDGRLYPWGSDWQAGLANTGRPEAGANDGAFGMSEVGTYKGQSPYGAYDMIGNAWEWTASDFKAYEGGRWPSGLDPKRDLKVIRGGSWASKSDQATTTFRRWYGARGEKRGYSYSGFRLAKDIS